MGAATTLSTMTVTGLERLRHWGEFDLERVLDDSAWQKHQSILERQNKVVPLKV
jgi:hypothetical protein